MDEIHGSSKRGDWETPPDLVTDLKTVFAFDVDVCASRPNVCESFYGPEEDGLSQPWRGLCWMNPPYGKGRLIDRWMEKAMYQGRRLDTTVVCLPPARTSTQWWHDTVPHADLCVFIKGRLTFYLPGGIKPKHTSGFPSAFVVFGGLTEPQQAKLISYGWAVFPRDT
jgi:phage N-6-adenine-methyltransferase